MPRHRTIHLSPEVKDQMRQMILDCCSYNEITHKLGTPYYTVAEVKREMGLLQPATPKPQHPTRMWREVRPPAQMEFQ